MAAVDRRSLHFSGLAREKVVLIAFAADPWTAGIDADG